MKISTKQWVAMPIVLGVMGMTAACGGSSTPTSTAGKSPSQSATAPETKTGSLPSITVTYTSPTGNHAPLWIGNNKGYFAQNGIQVKTQYIHGSATSLAALIGNHTDIYAGSAGHALAAIAKGAKLKIIGFENPTIPYQLYVDPSITSPSQLVGKNIGVVSTGDSSYLFVTRMLAAMHIAGKVHIVSTGSKAAEIAAFESHNVAGVPNLYAAMTQVKPGTFHALGDPAKYGVTGDANVFVVTDSFLQAHQAELTDFLKGYLESLAYTYGHPQQIKTLIGTELHTKAAFNSADYQAYFQSSPPDGGVAPDPTPTMSLMKEQIANEKAANPKFPASSFNPSQAMDPSLMQAIKNSSFWKKVWPNKIPTFTQSNG